jgi:hypothetical protein
MRWDNAMRMRIKQLTLTFAQLFDPGPSERATRIHPNQGRH